MSEAPRVIIKSIGGLDHTLYHWDQHSDTTVLFLHGFLDVGLGFTFVVDSLKDTGWNFIALDWRGHGRSAWISSGGYYHFIDYVRDLEDCVRQITTKHLYVVGHSMGAMALTAVRAMAPMEWPTTYKCFVVIWRTQSSRSRT